MKRYSLLTDDLEHCIECGRWNIELHEVYGGSRRPKSIEDGCVIPLCKEKHHRGNLIGIHRDKKLNDKYKQVMQLKWMEYYNKTEDEFRVRFCKSYLERKENE